MGVIAEGCKQDEDCPKMQYCYELSRRCVNYTICSRYNRLETDKLARHPSQCGPCITGYTAEVLTDGKDALYCTEKIKTNDSSSTTDQTMLMWILVGALCSLLILLVVGYTLFKMVFRKWYSCKRKVECVEFNNVDTKIVEIDASAPPEERNPFIQSDGKTLPNDNNAVVAIDKLVGASMWRAPNWVANGNYGTNQYDDDDFNVPNQENNVPQLATVHNVPNNSDSSSGPLAIQLPESTADQDNARNIVLMQTYLSNHDSNTDDNADNNTDNNTDPTPEPNENENNHSGKKTSMLINQMLKNITMNVNVINVNEI